MKKNFVSRHNSAVILAALCLFAAISGQAALQFYSGVSANKIWNTSLTDWGATTGGPYNAAWVNGNDAVFQGTAATITNSGVSANSITFSVASYILTNGVITMTGTTPRITNSVAANISAEISGTAGFTKIGTAGLTLAVSNSFTGRMTNSPGSANVSGVTILNNYALGATGAGNETVVVGGNNSGGGNLLAIGNNVVTPVGETVFLQCGASQRAGLQNVSSGNVTSIWSGDVIMSSPDGTAPVIYANSGSMSVLGTVRGNNLPGGALFRGAGNGQLFGNVWLTNSAFFIADSAVWTLSSNSNLWTYAQINGGKLKLGTNDALCTTGSLALGQGNANAFTFDMNGFNQSVAVVTNNNGSIVNLFTNSSVNPSIFTVNATAANSRIAPSGAGSIIVCGPVSFVKNGSFQLALGGANTYTGTNTINGGTLLITNVGTLGNTANPLFLNAGTLNLGGTVQTVSSVAIASGTITNGTLTGTSFDVQGGSFSAVLDGGGAVLNKTTSGTLTLSAVNTYSGATTVSGGKVISVTGGSANSSAFTFAPGPGVTTTNAVKVLTSGGQWSCATLTNTTANGGGIYDEFDYGTVSGPSTSVSPILVNGDGDVSGTLNIILKGGIGWVTGQAYPLLQISGNAPASIALNLVSTPVGVIGGSLSYDSGTKIVSYTAGNAPRGLTWIKGDGLWDINTATNWLDASLLLTKFQQLDLPTFDDSVGAGNFSVTNNSSVTPSAVVVNNNTANYTFTGSGSIGGATALTKTGTGSLTIASANAYNGGTVVSNGTLVLANTAALGSAALTIEGGALDSSVANLVNANANSITLNNDLNFVGSQNLNLGSGVVSFAANRAIAVSNNTLTVSGSLSAPGLTLTKNGVGTLRQGAANSLGGVALVLNEGKFDLNGAALGINGFVGDTNGTVLNNAGSGLATFTFGNANGGGTFNGTVTDNSTGSGTVAVTKVGLGLVTWSGSNSYSGPTIITTAAAGGAGCLFTINNPSAFGNSLGEVTEAEANSSVQISGNITVSNKTINIVGTGGSPSNTGGGINGNGSLQGAAGQTNTWAGIVRSGAGATSGRFGVQAGAQGLLVVSGSIRDGLTATGAGLDVVVNCDSVAAGSAVMFAAPAGVNTYSGSTIVGRGTLKLGVANTLPLTSVLNIGGSGSLTATFDMNGYNQTVGGLTHSGANTATLDNSSVTSTNTLTINQSTTTTYTGAIAGNTALNLVKTGAGQLTLLGNNSGYAGSTVVSNGTLLVNSDLGSSAVTVNGGAFGGTGSVNGTVNVNSGGTLSPGTNGIGTLTIASDLTLTAGSFASVQVDQGLASADQVTGLNTVTYGGTLVVTNLSGTLTVSDTFTLFSAATHVGNFSSISGSPGAGLVWSFTNGVLSVVAQSYANYPTNITASVSGSTLTLAWPATHLGWFLQAQTNALAVGLTTPTNTWFDVAGSDSSNTNVININAANPTVFYRLRMP